MDGTFLVGAKRAARPAQPPFRPSDPDCREAIEPDFSIATTEDVADACRLAD